MLLAPSTGRSWPRWPRSPDLEQSDIPAASCDCCPPAGKVPQDALELHCAWSQCLRAATRGTGASVLLALLRKLGGKRGVGLPPGVESCSEPS